MRFLGDRRQGHGSIRTRLTAVVVFSAVALVVMWLAVSMPRLYDAIYLRAVSEAMQETMPKAVRALAAVQAERAQSLSASGSGAELADKRTQTDQSVREVRTLVEPLLPDSPQVVQDRYADFTRALDELAGVRRQLDTKTIERPELYVFYNKLADVSMTVFETMARAVPDQQTAFSGVEVTSLFRAADLMSRAGTVAGGAITTGVLNQSDHVEFTRLSGAYRQQLELSTQNGSEEVRSAYQEIRDGADWKRLTAAEDTLINQGPWTVVTNRNRTDGQLAAPPVSDQEWRDVTGKVYADLEQLGVTQFADSARLADSKSSSGLTQAIIGSAIALLVALIVIIAAMRIMRSTARRLTRLRYETLDLAVEKLPPIVSRLRTGEQVDVSTELPMLDFGKDEIGQVARAFNAAHATAVEAAVQESQARAGVRNVFLGIAHRSQALVHRQLKILDKLEREQEDPQQLDALFTLDHLATRARRNAENLIILGGQQPGRAWRKPVLLADILRGAVAETTQYKRIRMQGVPRVSLVGSAVADTMHLLAELLDNATSFSPPQAHVRLSGEPAAKGIVVEVEDNGLGMDDNERDRHNLVLADPPDFESMALKGDPRLGLFVVARLAARHGIKVELRSSSYGGTRAIVLIPATLLVEADQDDTTSPFDPVPSARAASPDPDYVDDVLPFRVSLFQPVDELPAETAAETTGEVSPRALDWEEPEPLWPEEDMAEPDQPQPSVTPVQHIPTGHTSPGMMPVAAPQPGTSDKPALPRRRRQASLAPQLREIAPMPLDDEDPTGGRSPEEVRSIMSAFQYQTRRARDEDQ
ncbi:nitrate- and nitrite sensing domain-containing protein [Kibdelosporangium philippinense]|uniref:histidine kinase n=1 Tax=Kibdelosporangium philippinense TaxID=211113 RepID=A0ABS8ZQ15_9PSEU|nr:nitrate- and nitrite sensing domain-containing protein [Kibdelosporangium philippinense]MCE7009707.1 nitrate- and nitrite sensing domain-containing protein [Kibdelosporangium philippinense]